MQINLVFDSNALAAPQAFRNGVQAAANVLDATIHDSITVNIGVGYNEIDLGGPGYQLLTGNISEGGVDGVIPLSYGALRDALAAHEAPGAGAAAVNLLPNTPTLNGQSDFFIATAQAKALGAIPANGTAIDGVVGFPASFTGSALTNAAIVEELHALGLLNQGGALGLFSFSSPANHSFSTGAAAGAPAYFSLDGGNTNLASYAVGLDETLFNNQPGDPLNFPDQNAVTLTALDLSEISAIGFDVASTPTLAVPPIGATITAAGTPIAVAVRNASVAQGGSIGVRSLINAVSVPSGDAVALYGFYDVGNGGGHLALDGVTEPDRQWIYMLSTQLGALSYVGGSSPGSETVRVEAVDYPSFRVSAASALTVTTTSAVAAGANRPVYSISANDGGNGTADGTSGTTPYRFTVSRTGDTSKAATLAYAVAGSGPNPALVSLFQNPTGTVTLAAGAGAAVITINASGMPVSQPEGFAVSLSGGDGTIAVPSASDTIGANSPAIDIGSVAINAAAVYGFANLGAPAFTAVVNGDGQTDLGLGAGALTGGFIGGYVAGTEIRIMANLEQIGSGTAAIDAQFSRDMDVLSPLTAPGGTDVGFGFLAGLTTGGPTGLLPASPAVSPLGDIRAALGTDQLAAAGVAGGITGAVHFAQGYIDGINAGQGPLAALHGVEAAARA